MADVTVVQPEITHEKAETEIFHDRSFYIILCGRCYKLQLVRTDRNEAGNDVMIKRTPPLHQLNSLQFFQGSNMSDHIHILPRFPNRTLSLYLNGVTTWVQLLVGVTYLSHEGTDYVHRYTVQCTQVD